MRGGQATENSMPLREDIFFWPRYALFCADRTTYALSLYPHVERNPCVVASSWFIFRPRIV
jgi:hypothetical protein